MTHEKGVKGGTRGEKKAETASQDKESSKANTLCTEKYTTKAQLQTTLIIIRNFCAHMQFDLLFRND